MGLSWVVVGCGSRRFEPAAATAVVSGGKPPCPREGGFRVITIKGDYYSERFKRWAGPGPEATSWAAALAAIDAARRVGL